jgi:hypothetical protein
MSAGTRRRLLAGVAVAVTLAAGGCSGGGSSTPTVAAVVEGQDIPVRETEALLHAHLDEAAETAAAAGHGDDGDREERAGRFVLLYQIKHALLRHLAAGMGLPDPPADEQPEETAGRLSRAMAERLFPSVEITEAELRAEYERRAASPEPFPGVPADVGVAVPGYEAVHDHLRTLLLEERRQALFTDWFDKALRTADIVVDERYGRWDAERGVVE